MIIKTKFLQLKEAILSVIQLLVKKGQVHLSKIKPCRTKKNILPLLIQIKSWISKQYPHWKYWLRSISILSVVMLLLGLVYLNSPMSNEEKLIRLKVEHGDTLNTLITRYQKHHLIRSPSFAYFYGRLMILFSNKRVYRGEYELSSSMTTTHLLDKVFNNQHVYDQVKITIPEGYNMYEIAELMVQKKIITKPIQCLKWMSSKELLQKYNIPANTLEGYLYPTTYFFLEEQSVKEMIEHMLKMFWEKFPMDLYEQKKKDNKWNLSIHEVVSLASLVEKETKVEQERPLVAAVFHNRLKKRMRLQSDPTVIYALMLQNRYRGNLSKKRGDLNVNSPYNTYRFRGIPPSPIANPSYNSIVSIFEPAKVDYIFFVAKDERMHAFANNIRTHNKNVRHYVKWLMNNKKKRNAPQS